MLETKINGQEVESMDTPVDVGANCRIGKKDCERGATTVEYVIIASIVAALALAGGAVLKPKMSAAFTSVGGRLDSGGSFTG